VRSVHSSLHQSLDAAIETASASGGAAPLDVLAAGGDRLALSPIAVAAARELVALDGSQHYRSQLAANYLRGVLVALSRLGADGEAAAISAEVAPQRTVPVDVGAVAAACCRRAALPARSGLPADCLPQLLDAGLLGDASSTWLALHLPVDAWLGGLTASPDWLLQSPVQALLHASSAAAAPTELAALLLAQLDALLSTPHQDAAAASVAVLCVMQQLRLHAPEEGRGHAGRARLLDAAFELGIGAAPGPARSGATATATTTTAATTPATATTAATSATPIRSSTPVRVATAKPTTAAATAGLAPLVAWQLLQGMRADGTVRPRLAKFLSAAEQAEAGARGGARCAPAPELQLVRALTVQVGAQLAPSARDYLQSLAAGGSSAGLKVDHSAQLTLLRRLWESGGDDDAIEASVQGWLFEHPAAARVAVLAAIDGGTAPLLRSLGCEPLLLLPLGAKIAAAVQAELAGGAPVEPRAALPRWAAWLPYHLRGLVCTGGMLPLPRRALPYCLLRLVQLLLSLPDGHDARAPLLADTYLLLLHLTRTCALDLSAEASLLHARVAAGRGDSVLLAQVLCATLVAQQGTGGDAPVDEAHLLAILRVVQEGVGRRGAAALCEGAELLVRTRACELALATPSLELVEAARALVAAAVTEPALKLAHAVLSSAVGPHLAPLVPALTKLILLRSPLREAMEAPEGPLVLRVLAGLVAIQPTPMPAALAVELLVGSSNAASPATRREAWALMGLYCRGGASLPQLTLEQAADVAFCGEASSVLGQRLLALEWLKAGQARQMLKTFPVEMLVVDEPCAFKEVDEELRGEDEPPPPAGSAGSAAPKALGCLLVLRSMLRARQCDAPRWLVKGAAGLLVMGLSALSPTVRSLAYEGLAAFMGVLSEGPSFRERPHVLRLLRSLQDAITAPNQRLPATWAAFVAQGLAITAQPHHAQYKALNSFVLTRAYFDLDDVPMFFACFHSGRVTQREDRLWILALLHQGMRTDDDSTLCAGRHVLELVLGFHDASLADPQARRACLSLLLRAAGVPRGAEALLRRHGILPWIRLQCRGGPPLGSLLGLLALLGKLVRAPGFGALSAGLQAESGNAALDVLHAAAAAQHARAEHNEQDARRLAEGVVAVLGALGALATRPPLALSAPVASRLLATVAAGGVPNLMPELVEAIAALSPAAGPDAGACWRLFSACVEVLCSESRASSLDEAQRRARALVALLAWFVAQLGGSAALRQGATASSVRRLTRLYHFQSGHSDAIPLPTLAHAEWLGLGRGVTHQLNRILLLLSAHSLRGAQGRLTRLLLAVAEDEAGPRARRTCAEELLSVVLRGHRLGAGTGALAELLSARGTALALATQLPLDQIRAALASCR